jgi:hypothetical protein
MISNSQGCHNGGSQCLGGQPVDDPAVQSLHYLARALVPFQAFRCGWSNSNSFGLGDDNLAWAVRHGCPADSMARTVSGF